MSHAQLSEPQSLESLFPAFEIEHLISCGESGSVFKARQLSLDRDVALKILPRELGADPSYRAAFQANARAMAYLTHPNLIRVFDFGETEGLLYLVMEYVPGKSLQRSASGKTIDPKQAVEIVLGACKGIANAHENGIIHRDIKPANILLTPDCEPKLGNFGSAPGSLPSAYLAPETNHDPANGDASSDVYSIGLVLCELLTGNSAESQTVGNSAIPDLKLGAICRKATHHNPALRYSSASDLADELAGWLKAKSTKFATSSWKPSSNRPKRPTVVRKTHSNGTALLKNCAVIAVLLGAIHFTHGIYKAKQTSIAQQQQAQDSQPPIVKVIHVGRKIAADPSPSQALASSPYEANFVTAIAEGNMD